MTPGDFTNGYALIVGVGADLPITAQDAKALRDVLIDPDRAGYPPDQVELLTESQATREGVLTAFDRLIGRAAENSNSTVIVYFSGHGGIFGHGSLSEEYFLVPYGYDRSRRQVTAISGSEFTRKIEAIRARRLVVILDCCHAGGMFGPKHLEDDFWKSPVPPDLLNLLNSGSGRVVVASSHEEELSYTATPYSVFTTCLLEALEGKAGTAEYGSVHILDVLVYLFKSVPQRAPGPQHPYVKKVLDLGENFPICYRARRAGADSAELSARTKPLDLTTGQRQRIEYTRDALQHDWNLRIEKLKRTREALAIEPNVLVKFQLEVVLLHEESELARVASELDALEQTLGSTGRSIGLPSIQKAPTSWRAANRHEWLQDVVIWFSANYENCPDETMGQLLDHTFEIIRNAQGANALLSKVEELARQLMGYMSFDSSASCARPHHRRILQLLEKGIHRYHSHLFMVPQISKRNLLSIPDYSAVLLSTKLHAAGDYRTAYELVQGIATGCCLAQYIMGQSKRKEGLHIQAHAYLDESLRLLELWQEHRCPFSEEAEIICNEHFLAAEVLRAKAVVFRNQRNQQEAENFYRKASEATEKSITAAATGVLSLPPISEDRICADYEKQSAYRVKADVYFSQGYYWYDLRNYDRAKTFLHEAIVALEKANEGWDSPYTRLAVIQLCQGDYRQAAETFTKAALLCMHTPIERNREAPLSLALCTLGLRTIEICHADAERLLNVEDDPLDSLDRSLAPLPKLALSPLLCHRNDARHFLVAELKSAERLVKKFIERLDQEISKL